MMDELDLEAEAEDKAISQLQLLTGKRHFPSQGERNLRNLLDSSSFPLWQVEKVLLEVTGSPIGVQPHETTFTPVTEIRQVHMEREDDVVHLYLYNDQGEPFAKLVMDVVQLRQLLYQKDELTIQKRRKHQEQKEKCLELMRQLEKLPPPPQEEEEEEREEE